MAMSNTSLPLRTNSSGPPDLFDCFPELRDTASVTPPTGTYVPTGYIASDRVVVRYDGIRGVFTSGARRGVWRFTTEEEYDALRDLHREFSGTHGVSARCHLPIGDTLSDELPFIKRLCAVCHYVVNPIGHAGVGGRCTPGGHGASASGGAWTAQRRIAWVADAMLAADVRLGLLLSGTSDEDLGFEFGRVTNAEYQSQYLMGLRDRSWLVSPTGTSQHNIATAFECNYSRQDFRVAFLRSVFGIDVVDAIVNRVKLFDFSGLHSRRED